MSKSNDKSTELSEDRTLLSNERTFSSWMGTGLACVGVAIGLHAVFGAIDPTWLAKLVASIFLLTALAIYWAAVRQACKTYSRLRNTDVEIQGSNVFKKIAAMMSAGTLGVGIILWSL
jgi:putative membrane protein